MLTRSSHFKIELYGRCLGGTFYAAFICSLLTQVFSLDLMRKSPENVAAKHSGRAAGLQGSVGLKRWRRPSIEG